MALASGTRLGPYEIQSVLGAGGMGEVYRARDTKLDRAVAIKILSGSFAHDEERLARFEREAKTLAALNHPNIAIIHGFEEAHRIQALVMELVDGPTLADRIAQGPFALDEALPIAKQIAEALEAAHEKGIIHRDLKPANIALDADDRVKVLDFGLAKLAQPESFTSSDPGESPTITSPAMMTGVGAILGTAAYMSPEQAKGKAVDRRTDVWAFGCVLYEMLTGRRAFEGVDVTDTIVSVVSKEPQWSRLSASIPPSVHRLLRRCLEKNATRRLPHIGVARLELEDAQSGVPDPLKPSPPHHRGRYVAVGVLVGAAATAPALFVAMRATTPAGAPRQPIQLSVPVGEPNAAANGLLLSPDGRHLVTRSVHFASTLYALDGSPSRALEGIAMCWSPDGRYLVLQRPNGELLRMDVSSGPPVAFANVPTVGAISCSWSRHGTLLIDGDLKALRQVNISDGSSKAMELDDDAPRGSRPFRPQFLPDGRQFLYWSVSADGQSAVRAGSLDSRQTTPVAASDAPGIYAAGHLLFQRGATLVAQPFDARTLRLSDEPGAVTSEAAPGTFLDWVLFDASETGTLAFVTTNGGVRGHLVWVDRRGNVLGTIAQPGGTELLNPALSPDGTRVAGNRMDRSTGNWDVWVVDVQSGIPTRLTTQPGVDADPVWSPDGSQIAYVSRRRDAPGIYRLSIADGREQLLLKSSLAFGWWDAAIRTTDWTRDGRFVVYESEGNIMALPLANISAPLSAVAATARESSGQVSPDGRWIAFQSYDSGESHIHVQPFPGPGARTRVSVSPGYHPQWRGDGAELFWMANPSSRPTVAEVLYSADLTFVGNTVRAGAPKLVLPAHVTQAPLIDLRPHYAATASGQRFLLRQPDGLPGPTVKVILNWQEQLRAP